MCFFIKFWKKRQVFDFLFLVCYNVRMENYLEEAPVLTDVHNHSKYSPDGIDSLEDMLAAAYKKGVKYYGVSEHINYDLRHLSLEIINGSSITTDEEAYFTAATALKKAYAGKMNVLVGAEFGFLDDQTVFAEYVELEKKYDFDFIVNGLHVDGDDDYYSQSGFYENGVLRPKKDAYRDYFKLLRKSLDVPYDYDIVAHIGYCARYAPYEDKEIHYEELAEEIDDLLKTIIQKGKILEVNSSSNGLKSCCLPNAEILKRYYELGGREVSYASDAHSTKSITRNREEIVSLLKSIGFTYLTVPCQGKKIKVKI